MALSCNQLLMAVLALSRRTMNLLKWKCFIPGKQDTDWCVQCPCTSFCVCVCFRVPSDVRLGAGRCGTETTSTSSGGQVLIHRAAGVVGTFR